MTPSRSSTTWFVIVTDVLFAITVLLGILVLSRLILPQAATILTALSFAG